MKTDTQKSDSKLNVGVVGCGNISGIYFENCAQFDSLNLIACADRIVERAQARASEYSLPKACSVAELLADPEIDIVVNLTTPDAHAEVAVAAIAAGKSVYNEKPLAIRREDARRMLDCASEKGVRVGGAPDTFLGAGIQTCVKLLEEGVIGDPVAASAFMLSRGHESWHPAPEFYYKAGGGPMFDMGPYYLSALIALMGPVRRVTGSARISFPERTITIEPLKGRKIVVDVPTHLASVLDFVAGPVVTLVTSFDVCSSRVPCIEIYGSEGTLGVPDPNSFGGPVVLRKSGDKDWTEVALSHPHAENSRGLGVADMARAILSDRPHRASGELAFHVLDIMHAVHEASDQGHHIELQSTCARPEPLPPG